MEGTAKWLANRFEPDGIRKDERSIRLLSASVII